MGKVSVTGAKMFWEGISRAQLERFKLDSILHHRRVLNSIGDEEALRETDSVSLLFYMPLYLIMTT